MNIVWFKRDLRIEDNEAFHCAAANGQVLPLYILEPDLWKQPDMSRRHYQFLCDCLTELDKSLEQIGQRLIIKVGDATNVLKDIFNRYDVQGLWSYQETWNGWTYKRDIDVERLCKEYNVQWHEPSQNGVIRRLKCRDGWATSWYHKMKKPLLLTVKKINRIEESSVMLPSACELNLNLDSFTNIQKGGRTKGLKLLKSFLYDRGEGYTKEMSSPVTAYESCSRLSAHLAFGTLSVREVFQACELRTLEIKQMPYGSKGKWSSAMRSFAGRLRWHCHFIQKLEDQPLIEFENMHKGYDGLRENDFNEKYYQAWQDGKTGYPMVDACMRALIATGWLNFRMRAMLISFASQHLWLHWKKTSIYLAKLFTDYEPGIHYSQVQMQSGTTGINAIRIYNPIKQGIDHDPEGNFIRRWIPELKDMPQEYIHTPWKALSKMNGYPMPIIDEKSARRAAADKLYNLRKNNIKHKEMAQKIVNKHASRRSTSTRRVSRSIIKDSKQTELPI